MLRKRVLSLTAIPLIYTPGPNSLLFLRNFRFSQKKLDKIIISPEDYLKDTSFDTDVKAEWAQKEAEFKTLNDSQSDFRKKLQQELEETREEFKEAGNLFDFLIFSKL